MNSKVVSNWITSFCEKKWNTKQHDCRQCSVDKTGRNRPWPYIWKFFVYVAMSLSKTPNLVWKLKKKSQSLQNMQLIGIVKSKKHSDIIFVCILIHLILNILKVQKFWIWNFYFMITPFQELYILNSLKYIIPSVA